MRKIFILWIVLVVFITGCSKPKIVRIFPMEEVSRVAIEEIINDKDLSAEEKATIIQMKMAEDIERKKRAVEMEKDNKLSNIINKPITPLRTPDTILRVLILPYEDENGVLNGWKYNYVRVENGKWIMADYLNGTIPSSSFTLTPLKDKSNNSLGSTGMAPPINNSDIKYTYQIDKAKENIQEELKKVKEDKKQAEKARKQAEKDRAKRDKERAKVEKQIEKELKQIEKIDNDINELQNDTLNITAEGEIIEIDDSTAKGKKKK